MSDSYTAIEGRRRAFHYTAEGCGSRPKRFYCSRGQISDSAAQSLSLWTRSAVTLYPTDLAGVYRAQWFDRYSEIFRETTLMILEECQAVTIGGRNPRF